MVVVVVVLFDFTWFEKQGEMEEIEKVKDEKKGKSKNLQLQKPCERGYQKHQVNHIYDLKYESNHEHHPFHFVF